MYSGLERQLHGDRLVTANIFYWLPDFRNILQEFTWQLYDRTPALPRLCAFLEFWIEEIDGELHQVRLVFPELIIVPNVQVQNRKVTLEL